MDITGAEESIPDPFEVGDEDLEDEPPSTVKDVNPVVPEFKGTGVSQEVPMDSDNQSSGNFAQDLPEKANPPLPPKEIALPVAKPELTGNLQAVLSPNLFLPIPEVRQSQIGVKSSLL